MTAPANRQWKNWPSRLRNWGWATKNEALALYRRLRRLRTVSGAASGFPDVASVIRKVRARWSADIHTEWKRSLLKNRPDLAAEQVDRTSAYMDQAIPDALVTGYEPLIAGLKLPDPNDRHVLATAIRCNASVIVTFNQKDFPSDVLATLGIEAQHPDEFIEYLFDLDQAAVVAAAQRQRRQLKNPPMAVERYLDVLLRQGLVQTTKSLSTYRHLSRNPVTPEIAQKVAG